LELEDAETDSENKSDSVVRGRETTHGVLNWSEKCSADLQALVDDFNTEEFSSLDFSVTIADPSQPDCPLVGCSVGFTSLTGYKVSEIVGRNCRFLLNGVPDGLIDDDTRRRCRAFSISCSEGAMYMDPTGDVPHGQDVMKPWTELPIGELISVQTNARKSGELFRNMFYLKQVELDGNLFILGLQAGLPEEFEEKDLAEIEEVCQGAFVRLDNNMAEIEQLLASQFWYSAPMRRQL
jgi:hypothetical protein